MTALSRLILSSIFLLLAWPVGAEVIPPWPDGKCHRYNNEQCNMWQIISPPVEFPFARDIYANGRHNIEVSTDGKTWQPLPCLAQMEQAMRAMEPYLSKRKTAMTKEESDEYFLGKIGALLQWSVVRTECWSTSK